MKIDGKIRDEKLQYDINRKAAKSSALTSGKIDKYEYLTGEDILPSDQRRVIKQAKFTYSPLGKSLKNKIKQWRSRNNTSSALKALKAKKSLKALKSEENQEPVENWKYEN